MLIPRKVIAKRDDINSINRHFMKGDTIEVKSKGTYVDYVGVNLTRPELNNEHGYVYLVSDDFKELKPYKDEEVKSECKTIYFLGIPIFKIR